MLSNTLNPTKNTFLDLAEKNYENLVEALTNNSFANASSNPKPASPPSSSIFLNPYTQSYIFRIEESDTYHNSTEDVYPSDL
jgi:hypothetical protein